MEFVVVIRVVLIGLLLVTYGWISHRLGMKKGFKLGADFIITKIQEDLKHGDI